MDSQLIGIGLRQPHYPEFLQTKPDIGWIEVHSENYLSTGSPDIYALLEARKNYPVSLHGIAMSLGSAQGLDKQHLKQVKTLIDMVNPYLVSDHLSWSSTDNIFVPELLPVPYNDEALQIFASNISVAQDYLQRNILFENPSTYFEYNNSAYTEPEFLNLLAKKTGAGILLDINNIYTSALNNGWSATEYINNIDSKAVGEIHLAGHSVQQTDSGEKLYVDSHDNKICSDVWELYALALKRFGKLPTLVEWDTNIPTLDILLAEANKIAPYLRKMDEQYA